VKHCHDFRYRAERGLWHVEDDIEGGDKSRAYVLARIRVHVIVWSEYDLLLRRRPLGDVFRTKRVGQRFVPLQGGTARSLFGMLSSRDSILDICRVA
jgi:hypothetical protein